jgi:hypothetical protein
VMYTESDEVLEVVRAVSKNKAKTGANASAQP